MSDTREILNKVKEGEMSVEDAMLAIRQKPFEELGYAKVDLQRKLTQGKSEVVYGAGKTPEQISGIVKALCADDQKNILITRLSKEKAAELAGDITFEYYEDARIGIVGEMSEPSGLGTIVIATGGTSDMPVAEEAALTAEFYGNKVERLYDVGVAGIHRLLAHREKVMSASVVIAAAGMEGALASVVGGMVDVPVIAVPTSVGYGASFGGLSALLSMLNSCASGVAVVNIDNGFGAGFMASRINHMEPRT